MSKLPFSTVWNNLLAQQGRPFMTDRGREFTYRIDEENVLSVSAHKQTASRQVIEDAWEAMPCAPQELPSHCKPPTYLWSILHDTRIGGSLDLLEDDELKKIVRR